MEFARTELSPQLAAAADQNWMARQLRFNRLRVQATIYYTKRLIRFFYMGHLLTIVLDDGADSMSVPNMLKTIDEAGYFHAFEFKQIANNGLDAAEYRIGYYKVIEYDILGQDRPITDDEWTYFFKLEAAAGCTLDTDNILEPEKLKHSMFQCRSIANRLGHLHRTGVTNP